MRCARRRDQVRHRVVGRQDDRGAAAGLGERGRIRTEVVEDDVLDLAVHLGRHQAPARDPDRSGAAVVPRVRSRSRAQARSRRRPVREARRPPTRVPVRAPALATRRRVSAPRLGGSTTTGGHRGDRDADEVGATGGSGSVTTGSVNAATRGQRRRPRPPRVRRSQRPLRAPRSPHAERSSACLRRLDERDVAVPTRRRCLVTQLASWIRAALDAVARPTR